MKITFADLQKFIKQQLKSYDGIEMLKYDTKKENDGVFSVRYKNNLEDIFYFDVSLTIDIDECWVELTDNVGYGFDVAITTNLHNAESFYQTVKKMLDRTFADEAIKYNITEVSKWTN